MVIYMVDYGWMITLLPLWSLSVCFVPIRIICMMERMYRKIHGGQTAGLIQKWTPLFGQR